MLDFTTNTPPARAAVLDLYHANAWSAANKPDRLMKALAQSDRLECAYLEGRLVGLANAISDGALVVYFPHLLVHPSVQGQGIGRQLMARHLAHYQDFHQKVLLAVGEAAAFYTRLGFEKTDAVVPMWVYAGDDH